METTGPFKVVATFNKPEEAYLLASRLEGSGLRVFVRDAEVVGMYWLYANLLGGVKVEVALADYDRAREILEMPTEPSTLLECPHCGSARTHMRELSLTAGISLALGFFLPVPSRQVDCLGCKRSFRWRPTDTEQA